MSVPNFNGNHRSPAIDVTAEQLARTYAKAFVAEVGKTDNAAGLVQELESLVIDVLDRFPDFERALCGSMLAHDERADLIDSVLGGRASSQVINFLKALSANQRTSILRLVVQLVHKLYGESHGQYQVTVRVAKPLSEQLQHDLQGRLQARFGIQSELDIWIDPSLLGGIVVQIGDTVYDGSVRTILEKTRRRMMTEAVDAIENRPHSFLSLDELEMKT